MSENARTHVERNLAHVASFSKMASKMDPLVLIMSAAKLKKAQRHQMAGGLGFEPRLTESESAVLPLNYPPISSFEIKALAAKFVKSRDLFTNRNATNTIYRRHAGRSSLCRRCAGARGRPRPPRTDPGTACSAQPSASTCRRRC